MYMRMLEILNEMLERILSRNFRGWSSSKEDAEEPNKSIRCKQSKFYLVHS